jgi:hypothetical protein
MARQVPLAISQGNEVQQQSEALEWLTNQLPTRTN